MMAASDKNDPILCIDTLSCSLGL